MKNVKPILSKRGPYWPIGIYGDLLMIDIGTGPSVRILEIFNLKSNNLVFSGVWNGNNIEVLSPDKIVVYEFYNETYPNDDKGWTFRNILHAYLLDLNTYTKERMNKQIEIITN